MIERDELLEMLHDWHEVAETEKAKNAPMLKGISLGISGCISHMIALAQLSGMDITEDDVVNLKGL